MKRTKRPNTKSVHLGTQIPIIPLDTNDSNLVFDANGTIMGGTPEKLLSLITNLSLQDFHYISQFLSTYSFFLTTDDVLEHLIQTCKTFSNFDSQLTWLARQRILYIVTKWMKNYPSDFNEENPNEKKKLKQLIEDLSEPACNEIFKTVREFFHVVKVIKFIHYIFFCL